MDQDTEIKCAGCGNQFIFTVGEREFFRNRFGNDFTEPKRCQECRRKKREQNRERENAQG